MYYYYYTVFGFPGTLIRVAGKPLAAPPSVFVQLLNWSIVIVSWGGVQHLCAYAFLFFTSTRTN